jgi:hypothetical protein
LWCPHAVPAPPLIFYQRHAKYTVKKTTRDAGSKHKKRQMLITDFSDRFMWMT